jgi:hypothetical protein
MPYEIINSLRSRSVVRVVGNTDVTIKLTDLSVNTTVEDVTSASINHIISTSDGLVKIYRGDNATGTLVFESYGSCDLPLGQYDITIANSSTSNIFVTNAGSNGTVILSVTKQAVYPTPLTGM